MARYEIEGPDGGRFEIEGPDNATEEQILNFVTEQYESGALGRMQPEAQQAPVEDDRGWWDKFVDSGEAALKERALGILQTGMEFADLEDTDVYRHTLELADQYNREQEGGGIAGFVGEVVADPLTYVPFGAAAKAVPGVKKAVDVASKVAGKAAPAAKFVPGSKTVAKLAPSAAKGAAYGAAYGGLETVTEEDEDRLENLKDMAATGAVLGPLASKVAPAAIKGTAKGTADMVRGLAPRAVETLDDVAAKLQSKGSESFTKMREKGMVFSKPKSKQIVSKLRDTVGEGYSMNKESHKGTMRLMKEFEKDLLTKDNVGIDELYQWRKNFADMAAQKSRGIKPKLEDAAAAKRALKHIDDAIDDAMPIDVIGGDTGAKELLKTAKAEWAQFRKFEKVADIVAKAEGDPNKIQAAAKKLLRDKTERGFRPDEREVLEELANRGLTDRVLGTLSQFGLGGKDNRLTLSSASGAGLAYGVGGAPAVAAALAGGTLAKIMRNSIERGKADRLLKIIEQGGKIPEKEVMTLPTKVAKMLMDSDLVYRAGGKALEEQ